MRNKTRLLTLIASSAALVVGCSLINSFDDVKQSPDESEGGEGGEPGQTGGEGGTAGDSSIGGEGGVPEGGGAGTGGEGGSMPPPEVPGEGLLVLGGKTLQMGEPVSVLSTITTTDGAEVQREELTVAGATYDGTTDLWYIFTASAFPAPPEVPADLEIRDFDFDNNEWGETISVPAIPPPRPDSFAMLNDRLAYLSFRVVNNMPEQQLTILDISDPSDVGEVTVPADILQADLATGTAIGLLGIRGSANDESAVGGALTVLIKSGCSRPVGNLETCTLTAVPVFVGTTVTGGVSHELGRYTGTPGFASNRNAQVNLVALPAEGSGVVSILRLDPRAPDQRKGANIVTTSQAQHIGGLTFVDCRAALAMTDTIGESLSAISVVNGIGSRRDLERPGEGIIYDPYSATLIAPFSGGPGAGGMGGMGGAGSMPQRPELTPFELNIGASSVRIEDRDPETWAAPDDVRVETMATRKPQGPCP